MAIGGFPCTDISLAGRGAGIHGDESGLFFVLADAVRDLGVGYVFLENVAALTLRGLDAVLGTLAGLGFDAEWGCLRASDVGAPHRRDRWWCLAWRRDLVANTGRHRQPANGLQCSESDKCRPSARSADSSRPLVHAGGRQLQRLGEPAVLAGAGRTAQGEASERERCRHAAGDPGQGSQRADVGDPERQGLALGAPLRRNLGEERQAAQRAGIALDLPEWPPLPDDTAGWRAILRRWPELAPAVPESTVRRVADAGSGWDRHDVPWTPCDCNRADRLRGLGNGVCTAQAETALRLLWYRAFNEWP